MHDDRHTCPTCGFGWVPGTDCEYCRPPMTEAERERAAIVAVMRDAIGSGYPGVAMGTDGKCEHGTYDYEDCIACYDDFLSAKLDAVERGDHHQPRGAK